MKLSPTKRKRVTLVAVTIIVLAMLGVSVTLIVKQLTAAKSVSSAKLITKNPVMVGSYRYVNACQAVPQNSYKAVFGYDTTHNSAIQNTYADGSRTKLATLKGECTTDFGDTTVDIGGGNTTSGSVGTVDITLNQYTDPKLAATSMAPYKGLKGQDVDISALGVDDTVTTSAFETITVDGIDIYNNVTRNGRFYFAYRNVSIGAYIFDARSSQDVTAVLTPNYVKQTIQKIVPVIKKSIDNTQTLQTPIEPENLDDPVAGGTSAKVIFPCDYFTSADFKTVTGNDDDSTLVNAQYDLNPVAEAKRADPNKKALSGIGDISCKRQGYIATVQPSIQSYPDFKDFFPADQKYKKIEYPVINEAVRYFRNNDEAIAGAKQLLNNHMQSYPDTKNTEVKGLGTYAAFSEFTISSDVVDTSSAAGAPKEYYLYVAKGSYVVSIQMFYSSGDTNVIRNGNDAQMKQAAQLVINRLLS